jgi:hypothetical protein
LSTARAASGPRSIVLPERTIAIVRAAVSSGAIPRKQMAISQAAT